MRTPTKNKKQKTPNEPASRYARLFRTGRAKHERGFSLAELVVSIAIIGIITAVVVYNQSDFYDQISLTNEVNNIEVQIREAQAYGVSVKEFAPSSDEFTSAYGVAFNIAQSIGGEDTSYIFFADRGVKDGIYNDTWACETQSGSECIKKIYLSRNNIISDVCIILVTYDPICAQGGIDMSGYHISFRRPNPNAIITFWGYYRDQISVPDYQGARVTIRSPKGKTKHIFIYRNGQISIE